jgi:polynucleotide 5'-hydroxyl-kinase GRC3/NOL9
MLERLSDIAPAWLSLIEKLCREPWRRVIVIGAPDRGKSSFCNALLGALHDRGEPAFLLDAALAEKSLGPPACLTLGQMENQAYRLEALYFVGSGLARLADIAASHSNARLVIDTGGSVATLGLQLKRLKIDALQPALIVAIGEDPELEPFLASYQPSRVVRLPASPGVQPRNAMTRALLRLEAFQAVFAGGSPYALSGLIVEPWTESDWSDGQFICGLADAAGLELGLAILRGVDTATGLIHLVTTADPSRIRRLRIGMALPDELAPLG